MEPKIRKVHTKVSERDYQLLLKLCEDYGFKSLYQLLQILLRCMLRYANTAAYSVEDTSLGKEVEDMFDDFLDSPSNKSYTTYQRRRNE